MSVPELIRLSCLNDICILVSKGTGEAQTLHVSKLLLSVLEKCNTIDSFLTEIRKLDEDFPESILENAYALAKPRLQLCSTVEDDITTLMLPNKNTDKISYDTLLNNLIYADIKVLETFSLDGQGEHNPFSALKELSEREEKLLFPIRSEFKTSEENQFVLQQIRKTDSTQNLFSDSLLPAQESRAVASDFNAEMEEQEIKISIQLPKFLHSEMSEESSYSDFLPHHSSLLNENSSGNLSSLIDSQRNIYKEKREIRSADQRENTESNFLTLSETEAPKITSSAAHQNANLSLESQRQSLKIYDLKHELLDAVARNKVLILIGETGSGKTTQLTQYLAESGYTTPQQPKTSQEDTEQKSSSATPHLSKRIIGCTQPRRLPTRSVAERVALEYGCALGEDVGYAVRFEDVTSENRTVIKYMTDGILLREALSDPTFSKYSVIILDEAHERNINTDVLLGLLKQAQELQSFKLIITSATMNVGKFSQFFNDAEVFRITGRSYPVELVYLKDPIPASASYVFEAVKQVMSIHLNEESGDVLLFLPGKEEIEDAAERLRNWSQTLPPSFLQMQLHSIYASLPSEIQSRVFSSTPEGTRKIVISTNLAETSVTIDGIRYVVDCGVFKQKVFHPSSGIEVLRVSPISQAQANQRAGRSGRTAPGKCFRMYTEETFAHEMLPESVPEIQRSNLCHVVLTMKAAGVIDVLGFQFLDPPARVLLIDALHKLYLLGALDTDGLLTPLGRRMSEYPLDPSLSVVLLASHALYCASEALTILSLLNSDELFYRPKARAAEADACHLRFHRPDGDHLTMLRIYNLWSSRNYDRSWCRSNFLNYRSLMYAKDVRGELSRMMQRQGLEIQDVNNNEISESLSRRIRQAFTAGFFMSVARKTPEGYKKLQDREVVRVFPSSSMMNSSSPWVLYHSSTLTSHEYIRIVSPIHPQWLLAAAPGYYREITSEELLGIRKDERLDPLFGRNRAPDDWRFSRHYRKYRKHR